MSLAILLIGFILFSCGAVGLYAGTSENGEFALKIREALSGLISDPKTLLIVLGAVLAAGGAALVFWGSIKARRENKSRAKMSVRVMTVLAMLLAMTVMLDRFPGLSIKTPGWKIGFSFVPPMLAAMLYGPLEAAMVYGLSDLIGALLFPFGPYHPGFTVVAAIMGFVMGVFLNKRPFAFAGSRFEWKKLRFFPNYLLPVLINAIILGLVVNTYWVSQLYGSKTYGGWFLYRLVEYAILVPVQLVLIPVLLQLCETLKKAGLAGSGRRGASEDRLSEIARNESILGLERVTELITLLGHPEREVPVIHVAGTNGKGSFCAMLASVLHESGLKAGCFTSPALTGLCDGFRINGRRVEEKRLDRLLASMEPVINGMSSKPTEFEVLSAAAYKLFAEEGCDIAVIECGLGGTGDATNVIDAPLLSVITNVELDHTGRLGSTLAAIAAHKAGVIKKGRPVLWGGTAKEAEAVVLRRARELGSKVFVPDPQKLSVLGSSLEGTDIAYEGMGELRLALLGGYQVKNALLVLRAVEILRSEGYDISDEAVRRGLENVEWPARFEILRRDPTVVFDGSHNPDGVELAAESISGLFPEEKAVLLMGVMADKDHAKYPGLLKPVCEKAFCVKPENPRSLSAQALAEELQMNGVPAEGFDSFKEGVEKAYEYAVGEKLPLVAMGTLYMYKEFLEALPKE